MGLSEVDSGQPGEDWITANDLYRCASAHTLGEVRAALEPLVGRRVQSILDIGCGFGGITRSVADHLGATEVHGVDMDPTALREAGTKGVTTLRLTVGEEPLPWPEGSFDLIMCLGILDGLAFFDDAVREIHRLLRPSGHVLVSLPNLGSWHNRLSLLLGYQPRDVEVSREITAGIHPSYRGSTRRPTGHLHTVTLRALRELMAHHGFREVQVVGSRPPHGRGPVAGGLDRLLTRWPALARRFFYLGRKATPARGLEG